MTSETVDWHGRPAQLRRAVHVTYLDGQRPTTEILIVDDDAPAGGRRVEYIEHQPDG